MSGTTNETASGTIPTGDQGSVRAASAARSAVASCCINSAAMLQLADGDDYTAKKRAGFRELNERQAQLLFRAADIADDMLAALKLAEQDFLEHGRVLKKYDFGEMPMTAQSALRAIRAAIAKAEGQP